MDNQRLKLIGLPKISNASGNLTVAEENLNVPFDIKRVYWLYDVTSGASRGGHSHKACRELLIAISGSFAVTLDNGKDQKTFLLNHPYEGLLVENGIWRTLDDFSSGAVCLVLASELFDENDYIRHYGEFIKTTTKQENM